VLSHAVNASTKGGWVTEPFARPYASAMMVTGTTLMFDIQSQFIVALTSNA